ncbi:hypothetical protein M8J71_02700 [Pseudarthrobacter sp. R1]|uniref:hypothetical protein n=1 Tax=Pseudarthrobacter sp. R1 TaxID=2944934 RepID=UPI00210CFFA6|nr:hypothetical protein [Pseudarthrobacter sp. R1]MCQ6269404.1 hypothetical protein [Pseudarthrobacter sp. R1]
MALRDDLRPEGAGRVTSSLSDEELAQLLDSLYRNLDTPAPDPRAILWYEIGVEESHRRRSSGNKPNEQARGRTKKEIIRSLKSFLLKKPSGPGLPPAPSPVKIPARAARCPPYRP